ncbi:MAG: hypothetical protein SFX73_03430 [Kofleriaceae bacterium]|nr:hypothetical protein [Kofleriaceae bacterium]
MATKKPTTTSRTRATAKPAAKATQKSMTPTKLQNLAARPSYDDILGEDQLVDASGVFRVTSAISQAQQGHDEDESMFPSASGSLPRITRSDFDDGPTIDDNLGERLIQDEAAQAEKRARLNTLAARAKARNRTR